MFRGVRSHPERSASPISASGASKDPAAVSTRNSVPGCPPYKGQWLTRENNNSASLTRHWPPSANPPSKIQNSEENNRPQGRASDPASCPLPVPWGWGDSSTRLSAPRRLVRACSESPGRGARGSKFRSEPLSSPCLLASYLLISNWQKQVTKLSLESEWADTTKCHGEGHGHTGKGRELGPLCHSMAAMGLNGRRWTEARFSVALRAVPLLQAQLATVYHTGYVLNDQGMRSKRDGMNTGNTGPGSSQLLLDSFSRGGFHLLNALASLLLWQKVETILGITVLDAGQWAQFQCCRPAQPPARPGLRPQVPGFAGYAVLDQFLLPMSRAHKKVR